MNESASKFNGSIISSFSCRIQEAEPDAKTDQRIAQAIAQLDQSDPNLLVSALNQLCFNGRKPLAQQYISEESGYEPDAGDLIEPALKTAIPKLTALLNHPSAAIRKYAVLTLGGINSRLPAAVATPEIIKLLNDSNLEVKRAAIDALALLDAGLTVKAPVVIDALSQQLQSADLTIRAQVESLFKLFKQGTPRTPPSISVQEAQAEVDRRINALIAQLNNLDLIIQQEVIEALGDSGSAAYPAIPALLERLDNPELEQSVTRALTSIGDYALSVDSASNRFPRVDADLRWALEAGGINVKEQAAIALREAVEPVSQKLRDSSVANAAAIALGSWESTTLQSASPQTINALVEVINRESLLNNDDDRSLGVNAIAALGNTGTTDPAVIRRLIQLLESEDIDIRIEAIQALGRIGAAAQSAVDLLVERLQTPIPNTYTEQRDEYQQMEYWRQRIQSLGAISKIQPEAIASFNLKEFVLQAFQSASRKQDALSFSQLEPSSVPGLNQTLRRILSDSSKEYRVRYSTAFVLAFSDPPPDTSPETIQVLSGIVNDSNDDFDVRWISATVLAALGQDMDTFFTQYFLVNPTQVKCPDDLFIDTYLSFCEYRRGGGGGAETASAGTTVFKRRNSSGRG